LRGLIEKMAKPEAGPGRAGGRRVGVSAAGQAFNLELVLEMSGVEE
jgi:hypothetical protein